MSHPQRFEVTPDHIALLQRMYVQWDYSAYYGAPAVNIKRPYGNSDVVDDVHEICDWPRPDAEEDEEYTDEQEDRALKIHEQMDTVLQILVHNPSGISPGVYVNVSAFAPFGYDYKREDEVTQP